MPIYKVVIPIPDYYEETIFFQKYYFKCKHSPKKEEVVAYLEKQTNDPNYLRCGMKAAEKSLDAIKTIDPEEQWPCLHENQSCCGILIGTIKWGFQPLILTLIKPVGL